MRVPRQVTGPELAKALLVLGYEKTRQTGAHIRLKTQVGGTHFVTVPNHFPIKVGTLLGGILKPVAAHHRISVEELLQKIGL